MRVVKITTTSIGYSNINPYSLYSDSDGFSSPFQTGITSTQLYSGFTSYYVPDNANYIKIQSNSSCGLQPVGTGVPINPPTPTPTVTPSITPTNTVTPTVTPSFTPTNTVTPTATIIPTVTPTVTPSTGMNSIIQSGLTINTNGTYPSYPGTGTTWYDLQNNYNGTLTNGPTWNSGTGGYFSFDGVNDYVTYGNSSKGSDSVSKTFGGWVRTTTGAYDRIFYIRGDNVNGDWSFTLRKDNNTNKFSATVVGVNNLTNATATSTTTMVTNTWYYITARWISGTDISIFVNGTKEASTSFTTTNLRTSTTGWDIARHPISTYHPIDVGDFELYERALSDAEVTTNFNTRKSIYGY